MKAFFKKMIEYITYNPEKVKKTDELLEKSEQELKELQEKKRGGNPFNLVKKHSN